MKRRQLLIILATALLTTGCGGLNSNNVAIEADTAPAAEATQDIQQSEPVEEPEPEEPEDTYEPAYPYEEQLAVISDNSDLWELTEEDMEVFSPFIDYGYAIDDLDRDGYLEVIKTFWGDETKLYQTSIYETTDDKALSEWKMDAFRELDVEPCLSDVDSVYIIEDEDAKYMVYATMRESADAYWGMNTFYRMFIEDNTITLEEIKDGEQSWYFGNEKERFSWFKDVTAESLLVSYEKKYYRDERDTTGLYTAYLNGEAEAIMDCEFEDYDAEADYPIYDYKYIDCGSDGEYELQVFARSDPDMLPAKLSFVIKEAGGKLYIRYITYVEAERREGNISEQGFVGEFGKGGANLAIYDYGFLDADARYHFFYKMHYFLTVNDFDFGDDVEIDMEEWKDTQLMVYFLSEDKNDTEHIYYHYTYTGSKKYYENDNVFKNTLEEAGFKTYTEKEIKKILTDRAKEIGLDPSIRND